jgi:hypothetical protein
LTSTSKETGFDVTSDKLVGIASAKKLKEIPRAEMVHKVAKVVLSFWENKHPDQDE